VCFVFSLCSLCLLVTGILKGYDPLVNLVLDETKEFVRDPYDPYKLTDATRNLGLTVARGTAVMMVCPVDGTQEIANPFLQQEEQQQTVIS
jgi:U6 snRNA-associated Sm-like protein LSm7